MITTTRAQDYLSCNAVIQQNNERYNARISGMPINYDYDDDHCEVLKEKIKMVRTMMLSKILLSEAKLMETIIKDHTK